MHQVLTNCLSQMDVFAGACEELPPEFMERPEPHVVVRYLWCLFHLLLRCVRRLRLTSASSTDSLGFHHPDGHSQATAHQTNGKYHS